MRYFRSLPNKIGYLLGLASKKLDMIIYYERYVVIEPGEAVNDEGEKLQKMDFLTEEEYLNVRDAAGNYPENTGVDVDLSNNTATVTNFPVNVGLRHYHQQCQAMKGTNNNFTPSTNTSMGGDNPNAPGTPPSQTNILQVSDSSGNYKISNIRMRGFRGFQYHQNYNGIWDASTGQGGTTEHIPVGFGKVQIGTQQ